MIISIAVNELQTGMFLHKLDVFWLKHPLVHNEMLLTETRQVRAIQESGVREVWIDLSRGRAPELCIMAEEGTPPSDPDPTVAYVSPSADADSAVTMHSEMAQAQKICLAARGPVMTMFGDARLGKTIDARSTVPLVNDIAGSLNRHPAALLSVVRLKSHDDYTYLHSVAVCALMLSLADQLELDEAQKKRAGMAGLLHDVGKAAIPLAILNKPGRLTEEEFDLMKYHPVAGAEILRRSGAEDDLQDVAMHHHEKVNGSGYPHGLRAGAITLLSRMAAICDVYDAVTSDRPYKAGWNPASAMHQMASWPGHFDRKLLYAFVKAVGIYPVGSLVRLSSGRLGVVTEPGEHSLLQPKICVFFSLNSGKRLTPHIIDLASLYCEDHIIGPEEANHWPDIDVNSLWQQPVSA
ncbi:HD-GYP domain-containing protein [Erwinia persicina]|uniref:HD-GYP domain-containing protein n=1 Tax=Erwinia persicina TaxID=55211 RepID=UPI0017849BDC|nr:HD-GYP domain-containing protein [Erwinia persicina]MBD8161261.1 HD-GYP domain-containing protein [Erwinia persicina]